MVFKKHKIGKNVEYNCHVHLYPSMTNITDFPLNDDRGPTLGEESVVHRTQVLVLSENQNAGSIPGSSTCVLEQDT